MRCLKGTKYLGILFERKQGPESVVGYVYSDFAGDMDKRKSTTGYVYTLASGSISWRLVLQSTIALSTIEAEYMALTEASKEAIWLRGLVNEIGIKQESILIHCDSQSTVCLAKN